MAYPCAMFVVNSEVTFLLSVYNLIVNVRRRLLCAFISPSLVATHGYQKGDSYLTEDYCQWGNNNTNSKRRARTYHKTWAIASNFYYEKVMQPVSGINPFYSRDSL